MTDRSGIEQQRDVYLAEVLRLRGQVDMLEESVRRWERLCVATSIDAAAYRAEIALQAETIRAQRVVAKAYNEEVAALRAENDALKRDLDRAVAQPLERPMGYRYGDE